MVFDDMKWQNKGRWRIRPETEPNQKNGFDCFFIWFVFPFPSFWFLKGAEDKSEIQGALKATITKTISEGPLEPGNVTVFNMMPCIQPPQRWLNFYEVVSLWICIAPMLWPQERAARTLHYNDNNNNYNIIAGSLLHQKVLFSGALLILQLASNK